MITLVYTGDTVYNYLNAVLIATATGTKLNYTAGGIVSDDSVNIGSNRGTSTFFPGHISNPAIWDRILRLSEIQWLYNHPDKIYSTDSLKMWYKFNEFTGTVAGDSSGTGNDGTIWSAVWSIDQP